MPISEVHNIDCMEYMRTIPNKFFELAIVDPPYGIGHSIIAGKTIGKTFGIDVAEYLKPIAKAA